MPTRDWSWIDGVVFVVHGKEVYDWNRRFDFHPYRFERMVRTYPSLDAFIRLYRYGALKDILADHLNDLKRISSRFGYGHEAIYVYDSMHLHIPSWRILERAREIGHHLCDEYSNWTLRRLAKCGWTMEKNYRNGPVPSTGSLWPRKRRYTQYYRRFHTFQERRENHAYLDDLYHDPDMNSVQIKGRVRLNRLDLPNPWDDFPRSRERSWKRQRRTKYRT